MKVIPFIILLAVQVYLLNNHFYSISADESAHVLDAYNFKLFGIWLPFQRLFLAPFTMIDLFWTPRIISMILGHLTLLSLMLISKELFKNEMVTLLTGILGSVFVGIAVFSVLPLTEIYFFLFLLLSVYFLLKRSDWIYLSVLFMTMTRFEGWVFALIFMWFLRKDKKAILLMVFPLFWVILSYFETGSLTGFIHQVSERKRVMRTEDSVLYNFLYMSLTSGMILGLIYLKKNWEYLCVFIATLTIWTIATSLSGAMATHNVWRVGTIWVIMLIPFVAYLIYVIPNPMKIGMLFFIIYLNITLIQEHTKESYTKVEDLQAGAYLKTLDGKILMPRYGWEFMNLLPFAPEIQANEKIESLSGYDYLILLKPVKGLHQVYMNDKWFIYSLKGIK